MARGDGRYFKRGGVYVIGYYAPDPEHPGRVREYRESVDKLIGKKATEQDAKRWLKKRMEERAVHRAGLRTFVGPRQERVTVEELLTRLEKDHELHKRHGIR